MKAITVQNRKLLQEPVHGDAMDATLPPITTPSRRPFKPSSPFESSMALTTLVLLTALFFMGFFSVYIRRLAEEETSDVRGRRHPSPPPEMRPHGDNQKGLDPSSIKALPLVPYGGAAKHRMIEDCAICLSELEEGEIVKLIPQCRHVFHPTCVDTWLCSHVSCPLCRSTQFFNKVGDELWLDVMQEKDGNGVSEHIGQGSTAGDGATWREMVRSGVRRSCSCSSLGDRVVLQRSLSF